MRSMIAIAVAIVAGQIALGTLLQFSIIQYMFKDEATAAAGVVVSPCGE